MEQFQNRFQRYEKKYLLNEEQHQMLTQILQGRLCVDRFGKSTISNVYFDTADHLLIRRSLEKPIYKEKLRLRSYGTPAAGDTVFVELKKKYKDVVYKRRADMALEDAADYLYCGGEASKPSQITKEIDWVLSYYSKIGPAMFISYDRTALYGREDSNLRVTFDSRILWREEELRLDRGIWGRELLEPGQRLMEIKIAGAMPLWLAHTLDSLAVRPVSFSKYGNAYKMSYLKQTEEKEGSNCA